MLEQTYISDEFAAASPGERICDGTGFCGTATNDYMVMDGVLFRRFVWCNFEITAPPFSVQGEWQAVRKRWRLYPQKKAAA